MTENINEPEGIVQKKVTIFGYASTLISEKEFARSIDPENRDFTEKEIRENHSYKMIVLDEHDEPEEIRLTKYQYDAIVDKNAVNADGRSVKLIHEVENESIDALSTKQAVESLLEGIADTLPQEIDGMMKYSWSPYYFAGEEGPEEIVIRAGRIEKRDVLVHHSVRTRGHMYEDSLPKPSVRYDVTLEGTSEQVESWTNEIVGPFMKELANLPLIEKVRVSDCKVTKSGDCYTR